MGEEMTDWWTAKNRNHDGSVSIIGNFNDQAVAQKWADMWNNSDSLKGDAYVEARK